MIDLGGRWLISALIDSYTHIIRGGLNYNMELRPVQGEWNFGFSQTRHRPHTDRRSHFGDFGRTNREPTRRGGV